MTVKKVIGSNSPIAQRLFTSTYYCVPLCLFASSAHPSKIKTQARIKIFYSLDYPTCYSATYFNKKPNTSSVHFSL